MSRRRVCPVLYDDTVAREVWMNSSAGGEGAEPPSARAERSGARALGGSAEAPFLRSLTPHPPRTMEGCSGCEWLLGPRPSGRVG